MQPKPRVIDQASYARLPKHWQEYIDLRGGFLKEQFIPIVVVSFLDGSHCFFLDAFLVRDKDRQEVALFAENSGYLVLDATKLKHAGQLDPIYHAVPVKNVVDKEETLKIAALARLEMNQETVSVMTGKLNQVLGYVERIEDLDTEGVEPLVHPVSLANVFREDEPHESLSVDEALLNAPSRNGDYFAVPAVFEGEQDVS